MKRPPSVVLVPVKPPALAKSRLRVPDDVRPELARAFALDTVAAARQAAGVSEVVVVTSDAELVAHCHRVGLATEPDTGGLNSSLVAAAAAVRRRLPRAVAVALCADLPCLRPHDLATAIERGRSEGAWFVADADGSGTTAYAAAYDTFDPRFGADSRAAHRAAGAREVAGGLDSLRRDVDDEQALAEALRLGVGEHTARAVALLT